MNVNMVEFQGTQQTRGELGQQTFRLTSHSAAEEPQSPDFQTGP